MNKHLIKVTDALLVAVLISLLCQTNVKSLSITFLNINIAGTYLRLKLLFMGIGNIKPPITAQTLLCKHSYRPCSNKMCTDERGHLGMVPDNQVPRKCEQEFPCALLSPLIPCEPFNLQVRTMRHKTIHVLEVSQHHTAKERSGSLLHHCPFHYSIELELPGKVHIQQIVTE